MAAAAMLVLCVVTGGNSAKGNLGMMAAQMLAIPLLCFSAYFASLRGNPGMVRWGAAVALLIAVVPLLQLLSIPAPLWKLPTERVSLLTDLGRAGLETVDMRWTLSPSATERNLYFLLPGMALFFCMLAMGRTAWRRMLGLIVIVGLLNLVFAFVQLAAGQSSFLNPYPEYAPSLGGIFANRNHQADLLAIGLMLVSVFLVDYWKQEPGSQRSIGKIGALIVIALILVVSLPLVGSRAGVIVAMVMLMATLLTSGLPTWRSFRRKPLLQVGALVTLIVFLVGLHAANAWMQVDAAVEGSRYTMLTETVRIGQQHAPWGSGFGTFIPTFQQGAGESVPLDSYVNNAHNEYAQWWLEAGVAGVALTLSALAVLIASLIALLRQRQGSTTRVIGVAAMMGIGVIVLHSTVDYPLRTQAMSAIFGVLAGIAIGAARTRVTAQSNLPAA